MRSRRLFLAAAAALAACCLTFPTREPSQAPPAARTDPVIRQPAGAGWQPGGRDRRKLLVVDSVIAFTDGIGASRIEARHDSLEKPPDAAESRFGRRELYVALLLAIANARQRVWLTDGYFVPDERMLSALERAAQRGVDVRVVLPGRADSWVPYHAGRARYGRLLAAGVHIFERRDAFLPTRMASASGVWTGFEPGGERRVNSSADLLVFDRGLAHQLEQLFRLDEAASRELSLAEWRRRSFANRFKEWLARCCERLL